MLALCPQRGSKFAEPSSLKLDFCYPERYPDEFPEGVAFPGTKVEIMLWFQCGERGGARTHDPVIKSHVLYRLSYALAPMGRSPADGARAAV